MMQRRKVETSAATHNSSNLPAGATTEQKQQSHDFRFVRSRGSSSSMSIKRMNSRSTSLVNLLFLVIVLVAVIAILSPSTVEKAEHDAADSAKEILKEALLAEQQMEEFFHLQNNQHPPPGRSSDFEADATAGKQRSKEATEAMIRQPSNWVDGEKKLKKKLKELEELQKAGKLLEVPILTRWLGDDFPAWVSEGQDQDEWERKRKEKYAEMAREEELWRANVRQYLEK